MTETKSIPESSGVIMKKTTTTWGRTSKADLWTKIGSTAMVCACPIWVTWNWMALEDFDGSLLEAVQYTLDWKFSKAGKFDLDYLPKPTWTATFIYIGWLAFQAVLYSCIPGRTSYGQRTPGGNVLRYTTNGLNAWVLTHLLFLLGAHQDLYSLSVIARNFGGLFVVANVYGYVLAAFSFLKAHWFPTHANDRKFSGSWIYDFWMGIELNPRIGSNFDFKLFHNGRPGIVAWTLIDISFAAHQQELHGYVSNSMVLVMALHAVYVLDFFANEDWYLRTIDIAHDHFGMYLAWGDAVFLPSFYTLQAQYLARYPANMTSLSFYITLAIGLSGYVIFRSANEQKDHVRQSNGDTEIWGSPATYIKCRYRTLDSKLHTSILLTCGWWGQSRHM